MKADPLGFTHRTNLGTILRQIEAAPDEMSRWKIQRDMLAWLQVRIPKLRNHDPEPLRLEK